MTGLIQVYCGDGKGKTTAALGQVMRACGSGMKIVFAQLMKTGTSGELNVLKEMKNVKYIPCTKSFGFVKDLSSDEKTEAAGYYSVFFDSVIETVIREKPDMLVIDEFMSAYNYDFIDHKKAISFLQNKPENTEIILTGRDPAKEIIDIADYVSDIKKIKHPFDRGIMARKGIEM